MDLHANFFRTTFSDPEQAAGLLRTFLPAGIAAAIDWRTLKLCDTSFLDQDLRNSDADLLFSVVVHHGPQGWHCARDVVELIDLDGLDPDVIAMLRPFLPRLAFLLADMPDVTLDRLRQLAMPPLARLALVMLQFLRDRDAAHALLVVRTAIDLVRQVHAMPGGSERLDQVWYYSFKVSDLRPAQVQELVATMIDPRAGDTVMTTADRIANEVYERFLATDAVRIREEERVKFMRIREEERAKFLATANHIREEERTRAESMRAQDRAMTLLRQIEKRFGPVPEATRSKVLAATMGDLERWLDGILDAPTLAALIAD